MYNLLKNINNPTDLRHLKHFQLKFLAQELRSFLLNSVSETGGHLSSNLGVVELTIALHYVFNTPYDRIIWDVGHQSYIHKILTGRRDKMHTIRKIGGISGFPRPSESEYDVFGTAHSSTSISAALGVAIAAKLQGKDYYSIAIIGDGAMTAGMAFEAINNACIVNDISLIVVLNDNKMSISPAVGSLNSYLSRLEKQSNDRNLLNLSNNEHSVISSNILSNQNLSNNFFKKNEYKINKSSILFEEFGFNYTGPIDGHDFDVLIPILEKIKKLNGLQFLHIITRKGKGYKFAEEDPVLYHSLNKFNINKRVKPSLIRKKTYVEVFSEWLCDIAEIDSRVVCITPAMREGSGLAEFEKRFPSRYFDVGIAEQHAITFAGGLAIEGLKPVVVIYSTFLQRAYDQLIHDIAIQNLPVIFAVDRAGLVGEDGCTHAGAFDLSFLRCIPNMTIMAASDENECRQMLYTALKQNNPSAVRYPRGVGIGVKIIKNMIQLPLGKAEIKRKTSKESGKRIVILAFGSMVHTSISVAENIDATIVNMRFIKPIDKDLLVRVASTHDAIVTIEENSIMSGAGSACIESLLESQIIKPVLQIGLPDRFINQGDYRNQLYSCGLDEAGITKSINKWFSKIINN